FIIKPFNYGSGPVSGLEQDLDRHSTCSTRRTHAPSASAPIPPRSRLWGPRVRSARAGRGESDYRISRCLAGRLGQVFDPDVTGGMHYRHASVDDSFKVGRAKPGGLLLSVNPG